MSLEENLKNNKNLLIAALAVIIGLIIVLSTFTIALIVKDENIKYISSSAPNIIINQADEREGKITENLPQSLREQKYMKSSDGLTINNNINVHTTVGGYYPYPKKYYNYPYKSYYPYKPYSSPYYHYHPYPKHYFYYSNSYGTYHKYYYY